MFHSYDYMFLFAPCFDILVRLTRLYITLLRERRWKVLLPFLLRYWSDFWSAWSFRQTVELPSEEREKDEIGKDGNSHYLHSGFSWDKQTGNHAHEPDHPEDNAHPPEASAKIWSPEHGHAEDDETHRHEEAPYEEERVRYALGRLP